MQLYSYQQKALEFFRKRQKVFLALDMGLGKTVICLKAIQEMNLKALVIAPLEVAISTWPEEIEKWKLNLSYKILHGKTKNKSFNTKCDIHLINYEGLNWLYSKLYDQFKKDKSFPYNCLILDESTAIKDSKTARFKILDAVQDMFEYKVCLSGTPAPNALFDLWGQYYILNGGESLGKSFRSFMSQYYEKDSYRLYCFKLKRGARDDIYSSISSSTFRLSEDDYANLPDKVQTKSYLVFPSKIQALYKQFQNDFTLALKDTQIETFNQAALSCKSRQFIQGFIYENLCGGDRAVHSIHNYKVRALKTFIEQNKGKNILCAIQYKHEQDMLAKEFPEAKFFTGSTSRKERKEILKTWNEKKIPLLIVHPKTVSKGLNLQYGGHILVWYALTYSLLDYLQLNKRLHRTGQKSTVLIHHIIVKKTIDELVYKALQLKNVNQSKLLEYLRLNTKDFYCGKSL